MITERLTNFSEKIKSRLKVLESSKKLVPGFEYSKATITGEELYQPEQRFIKADRKTYEMPVKPDYEIITGVNLIGAPTVIIHEELAASPRNPLLPTVIKLEDINYYKKYLMQQQLDKVEIPKDGKIYNVTSPIEVIPFATHSDFFADIKVQYAYGVQSIWKDGERIVGIEGVCAFPRAVNKGKIDISNSPERKIEGLAYVTLVRAPVNLREFFNTPKDVEKFSGDLPFSTKEAENTKEAQKAQNIFEELFQPKLEKIVEQVGALREKPVKGILLSPIVPHYRFADNLLRTRPGPKGELLIAASYLV